MYVTELKNHKSRRLSAQPARHPCWLAEEQLAWLSSDTTTQQTEVRIANLTTGENSVWQRFPGKADWLAVHPDKKRIAFVQKLPDRQQTLVLRDLEKGTETILTLGAEYEELRWMPDGAALSWSGPSRGGNTANNGVWMMRPEQRRPRQLTPDGYGPVWSADGASVYFSRFTETAERSGFWRLNLQRHELTIVRSGWEVVPFHDLVGERLVFTQYFNRGQVYALALRH